VIGAFGFFGATKAKELAKNAAPNRKKDTFFIIVLNFKCLCE
jgi:hypothetical protein